LPAGVKGIAVFTKMVTVQVCPGSTCPPVNLMVFVLGLAVKVGAAPH